MNLKTLLEFEPLPAAVTSLLDSFATTHHCDVKVWSRNGEDWVSVYPRGDLDYSSPSPGQRKVVDLPDNSELEIECAGGAVRCAA